MKRTRTYLASLGSGASLLAASVAVFAVLGGVVAFNGMPTASAGSEDGTILVDTSSPEAAAVAAASPDLAPAAVAPTAALLAVAAPAPLSSTPGSPSAPGGPTRPPGGEPPGPPGPPAPPGPPDDTGGGGGDGNPVDQVNDAIKDNTGIDLGEITGPIGDVLDEVTGALGGLGNGSTRNALP